MFVTSYTSCNKAIAKWSLTSFLQAFQIIFYGRYPIAWIWEVVWMPYKPVANSVTKKCAVIFFPQVTGFLVRTAVQMGSKVYSGIPLVLSSDKLLPLLGKALKGSMRDRNDDSRERVSCQRMTRWEWKCCTKRKTDVNKEWRMGEICFKSQLKTILLKEQQ